MMRCPFCLKRITVTIRLARDPVHPAEEIDGAPFLCHGCKRLSIVIGGITGPIGLRRPTEPEVAALATAQAIADQLPPGTFALDDLRTRLGRKH